MFCYEHQITLSHSSDYFPQGNGLAESSNKNLIVIMKKLVDESAQIWHKKVYEALWADKTMPKRAIGMEPFELVYGVGTKLSLPLELSVAKLQTVVEDSFFQSALEKRIMYLMKLEEERELLVDRILEHQSQAFNAGVGVSIEPIQNNAMDSCFGTCISASVQLTTFQRVA
ncbi:uncharacterized protein LOC131875932 [Cryptomeria japonica]|uniref:uncharacterized protein LOC131875932 n=1 Tax=Cryptomeria japonica TaxID=3369 RepID=UPI0027DA23BD|nr:uncharacterized protein LOC131875932 [Cryptomeria japonica]